MPYLVGDMNSKIQITGNDDVVGVSPSGNSTKVAQTKSFKQHNSTYKHTRKGKSVLPSSWA